MRPVATFDSETHDLSLHVVVFGAAASDFLSGLALTDGLLALGEYKGWKPRVHFHSFGADPWSEGAGEKLEGRVPDMDALVLTDDFAAGKHYSARAVEQLARTLRPGKIAVPTVVFGGGALKQEWETLANVPVVLAVEPKPEHVMQAVKAAAKAMLQHVHPR
jgi:hypothetical protein